MFRVLSFAASGAAFFMMLLTTVDILARYLLGKPVPGTIEISKYLMIALVFLGAPYAQAEGRNVRIQFLIARLPETVLKKLNVVVSLLLVMLGLLLTWKTGEAAYASWQIGEYESTAMTFLPEWLPKCFLALGCLLLFVQFLVELLRHLNSLRHG
jgi:TRAP-type C4-dicarboxylate transport system permease small subunit